MSTNMSDSDLIDLFEEVLDHRASDARFEQLEALLDSDAGVRNYFAQYSMLEVDLQYVHWTNAVNLGLPFSFRGAASRLASRWSPPAIVLWSLGVAASLLLAVVIFRGNDHPAEPVAAVTETDDTDLELLDLPLAEVATGKPPGPVATLSWQENATWQDEPMDVGHVVREGSTIYLTSGQARLSAGSGAEIHLQAPCLVSFASRDRLLLHRGEVTAKVAPWATGFTVVTAAMEVIDLGTVFKVNVTNSLDTIATVLQGQVRVCPTKAVENGPRSMLLAGGDVFAVNQAGVVARRSKAVGVDEKVDFGSLESYHPLVLHNTGVGVTEGDEDPNWRVVAGPGVDPEQQQFAMVCKDIKKTTRRYIANDPEVSQWISIADWKRAKANSIYTFQTTFDLASYDLDSIQFFGRFLSDNGIQAIRINGEPLTVEAWIDNADSQQFGKRQFRYLNITEGFLPGTNVVEIDVWDGTFMDSKHDFDDPNPMALRVEWHAFGRKRSQGDGGSAEKGDKATSSHSQQSRPVATGSLPS